MTISKRAATFLGASLALALALLLTTSAAVRAADENREPALKYRC